MIARICRSFKTFIYGSSVRVVRSPDCIQNARLGKIARDRVRISSSFIVDSLCDSYCSDNRICVTMDAKTGEPVYVFNGDSASEFLSSLFAPRVSISTRKCA